ncbi:MAG: bifunctional diaminohydroxyphosphoribosylaminopyrimidine deaminase/5-amino-6-(5-phosphoribosylamino)uracil reductase RibD [Planctomycetota bacterium]|nr:bifunctional diaminohydroxyphosphoribosylaminopyrimidine deaminase/5-amino-6-(5-phosphoribosylamino)uracil reductase RibD [Planctomycetota bacterium]
MGIAAYDAQHMTRALALAARGQGLVEPNPMVGCVIARGEQVLAEGWHGRFGGPHAEIEALRTAGAAAAGATLYVTLEPCCHAGKTPPCTAAVIAAGLRRVVVAQVDPFPRVAGGGLAQLQAAGLDVEVGLCEPAARRLNAPYLKLVTTGRPWIIAKWAMTLDGKIATHTGSSQWISGVAARAAVHQLRGRVDALLVGRGTAAADDPLLTARPPGVRTATRIVVDTHAALSLDSRLVQTARETPVLVASGPAAPAERRAALRGAGCEVWVGEAAERRERLGQLLDELGSRRMTNVLVEGGGQLLGSLFDLESIDEVHAFIAPKLVGGAQAPGPLAGRGVAQMLEAVRLEQPVVDMLENDLYLRARVHREG